MKKTCLFGFCLALAALLCGCGRANKTALPYPEQRELLEDRPLAETERADTERMINLNCANRALLVGDTLYTMDFDSSYNNVLASYQLDGDTLSFRSVLADGCVPKWLSISGQRLYYVNALAGDTLESIGVDGEGRRVELDESCSYLQVSGDALYYCDSLDRLRKMAEGGAAEIVIDEACAYPQLLDGAVLYQTQERGERLCLRWLDDATQLYFTDSPAYAPVIIGEKLCYTQSADGGSYISGMRIDGTDAFRFSTVINGAAEQLFRPDGNACLRYITNTDRLRQWSAALDSQGEGRELDSYGYRLCDYAGGGYRVDAAYQLDGSIRCFVLVFPDGRELEYIAGEVK